MRDFLLGPLVQFSVGTIRVKGVPKLAGDAMRTLSLGLEVELPVGHDLCEMCSDMRGAMLYELSRLGQ